MDSNLVNIQDRSKPKNRERKKGYDSLLKKATKALDAGKDDEALSLLDQLIGNKPSEAEEYVDQACALAKKGSYDDAITAMTCAIKIDPNSEALYLYRGSIYHKKGDLDLALADYDTVTKFNPASLLVYINRASILNDQGNYARAIIDCNIGIGLDPFCGKLYLLRADAYCNLKQIQEVLSDLYRAIMLNPSDPEGYFYLGNIKLFGFNDAYGAFLDLKKAASLGCPTPKELIDEIKKRTKSTSHKNTVYSDNDLAQKKEIIEQATELWRTRCHEYFKRHGNQGVCVLGGEIKVCYLPPRKKNYRYKSIICVGDVTGDVIKIQGNMVWESSANEILDYLKSNGIKAYYDPGVID